MIQILSLLKNKWSWIILLILSLSAYAGVLKLENSNTLLSLKDAQTQAQTLTLEKKDLEEKLTSSEQQLQSLIRQIQVKEQIIKDQRVRLSVIDSNKTKIEEDIRTIKEADHEVADYLNTPIPDILFERLSNQRSD